MPSINNEKLALEKVVKLKAVGPPEPEVPVHSAPGAQFATRRLSRKRLRGALVPFTELPKVPLKVNEPISKPAGSVMLKVLTVIGGRGNVPPTVNVPLKSGTVKVIVSALLVTAAPTLKTTNSNARIIPLCKWYMVDSSPVVFLLKN